MLRKIHASTNYSFLARFTFLAAALFSWLPALLFTSPLPSPHPSYFSEPASVYYPAQCLRPVEDPSAPQGGRPSFPFIVAQRSHSCLSEVAVFGWYCPFCQSFLFQSPPTNWSFCLSLPFASHSAKVQCTHRPRALCLLMPRPVEAISTPQGVDLLAPPRRCVFRSRAKNYLALADSLRLETSPQGAVSSLVTSPQGAVPTYASTSRGHLNAPGR